MKEIKIPRYPRLPRRHNRSCKLRKFEIEFIPKLINVGMSQKEVALFFRVSQQAISHWLKSKEERQFKRHSAYLRDKAKGKTKYLPRVGIMKELYHRRRKLFRKKCVRYATALRRRHYYTNPNLKPYILKNNKKRRERNVEDENHISC